MAPAMDIGQIPQCLGYPLDQLEIGLPFTDSLFLNGLILAVEFPDREQGQQEQRAKKPLVQQFVDRGLDPLFHGLALNE